MSVINVPPDERDALKAIDVSALRARIERSLQDRRVTALLGLGLEQCGPYVASRFWQYRLSLEDYAKAKAPKKTQETEARANRTGDDLLRSVEQMKERVAREEIQDESFRIDDQIVAPYRLDEKLSVCIHYQWRSDIEGKWTRGSITFFHQASMRPDYRAQPLKRKTSTAKRARDRQELLYSTWEHLLQLALHSVKQYFLEGRDALHIPTTFQARVSTDDGQLNNFSAKFWLLDHQSSGNQGLLR